MNPNTNLYAELDTVESVVGDFSSYWAARGEQEFVDSNIDVSDENIETIMRIIKDLKDILKDIDPIRAGMC